MREEEYYSEFDEDAYLQRLAEEEDEISASDVDDPAYDEQDQSLGSTVQNTTQRFMEHRRRAQNLRSGSNLAQKGAQKTVSEGTKSVAKKGAQEAGKKAVAEGAKHGAVAGGKAATAGGGTAAGAAGGGTGLFWAAVASLVVVVLILQILSGVTVFQVFGYNENACTQDNSSPAGLPEDTGDTKENAKVIANWLMATPFEFLGNKPMTKEQASGVLGNLLQESQVSPTLVQNNKFPSDVPNAFITALGDQGGRGVGLIQWDGEARRTAMVAHADSLGVHWTNLGAQLEFIRIEVDGSEKHRMGDFAKPGMDTKYYTEKWERGYERAGKPNMPRRIKHAESFFKTDDITAGEAGFPTSASAGNTSVNGGYNTNSGGGCTTGSAQPVDDVVELATLLAWPPEEKARAMTPRCECGKSQAKPEYVEYKEKAMKEHDFDGYLGGSLYNSCDRFVATVLKNTIDPDIPWGSSTTQYEYLKSSPKWEAYHNASERQPGDVFSTPGHIMIYVGDFEGHKDQVAQASHTTQVGLIKTYYLGDNMNDGRQYTGFRFVG